MGRGSPGYPKGEYYGSEGREREGDPSGYPKGEYYGSEGRERGEREGDALDIPRGVLRQ